MNIYNSVIALGGWSSDFVIELTDDEIQNNNALSKLIRGVVYVSKSKQQFMSIYAEAIRGRNERGKWYSGGSVNNSLYSMGLCRCHKDNSINLVWTGELSESQTRFGDGMKGEWLPDPLISLRKVGISTIGYAVASILDFSICIVDAATRETRNIVIFTDKQRKYSLQSIKEDNYLLLMHLSSFFDTSIEVQELVNRANGIAVIMGDPVIDISTNEVCKRGFIGENFKKLLLSGKILYIAGTNKDLVLCGIVNNNGMANQKYANTEVISTNGSESVTVWDSMYYKQHQLSVVTKIGNNGSSLGAGDSYFGAYLYSRLQGNEIPSTHIFAQAVCNKTLSELGAQARYTDDLNKIFPCTIERLSDSDDEGVIFDRVRFSPGFTVLSGGQIGVDQLALKAAELLGLPAYAILPKGFRTDNADVGKPDLDKFYDAMVLELDSSSYRYRTWASVYFSDGTIIWDYCNSEGTDAAISACKYFHRPYLLVNRIYLPKRIDMIVDWVKIHNIRILNFAGNRLSYIPISECDSLYNEILKIMKKIAWTINGDGWKYTNSSVLSVSCTSHVNKFSSKLRVGVPKTPVHRLFFNSLFTDLFGVSFEDNLSLVQTFPDSNLNVFFSRPRDLLELLKFDIVDIVFIGSDLVDEYICNNHVVLLNTGLFSISLGIVSQEKLSFECLDNNTNIVVSQYPQISNSILTNPCKPILGSAEIWVREQKAVCAIDSWRTGKTAFENGLKSFTSLKNYSMVLISDLYHIELIGKKSPINLFKEKLIKWLN